MKVVHKIELDSQDFVKKLLDRAEERNRGKIPTATLKAIFTATNEDQVAMQLKRFEGN